MWIKSVYWWNVKKKKARIEGYFFVVTMFVGSEFHTVGSLFIFLINGATFVRNCLHLWDEQQTWECERKSSLNCKAVKMWSRSCPSFSLGRWGAPGFNQGLGEIHQMSKNYQGGRGGFKKSKPSEAAKLLTLQTESWGSLFFHLNLHGTQFNFKYSQRLTSTWP